MKHIALLNGALMLAAAPAMAAYVMPMMGGGQTMESMKHADITFDGTNIGIHVDETVSTPWLRPLTAPDEFDPAKPWSVLGTKAYNFQYAFNPGGFITLPANTGIWVERLSHSDGLEVYLRPPMYNPALHGSTWPSILASDGAIWKWSGNMQHNAYAVLDPTEPIYTATYRVYIGDATTGTPLGAYGSDTVTFTFNATPVPEPTVAGAIIASGALLLRRRR